MPWSAEKGQPGEAQPPMGRFQVAPAGSVPFQHLCICFTRIRTRERERRPFCGKLPSEFFKGSGRVSYTIKC